MNNLHHIATTIANQYDRHPNDLKRKRYSKLTSIHEMKQEFVRRCWKDFNPEDIAQYLDHNLTTVYRLYDGMIDYKWKRIIRRFRDRETVFIKPKNYYWIPKLRDKGHCIVNVGKYQYKLIQHA